MKIGQQFHNDLIKTWPTRNVDFQQNIGQKKKGNGVSNMFFMC